MKKNVSNLIWGIVDLFLSLIFSLFLIFVFPDGQGHIFPLFLIVFFALLAGSQFESYFVKKEGQYNFNQIQNDKKFKVESILYGFEKGPQFWGGMVIILEKVGRYIVYSVPGELFKDNNNKPEIGKSYIKVSEKKICSINENE